MLCLAAEQPTYGFALAGLPGPQGSIGRMWYVRKINVYRALRRLESLGLIQTEVQEPSTLGPARSQCEVTAAGQAAARDWLHRPVAHGRDVRSELLPRLALLDRAGADPEDLLRAQLAVFGPIAAALEEKTWTAGGFERILTLRRHKEMQATMHFLHDELTPR